ncbi:MAG TPA: tRNA lysidine(34) synthetase TilS [Sphingobium sp.]
MAAPERKELDLQELLARSVRTLTDESVTARFGVAVSGGPDSMALLCLAARAFPGRVEAATVDHGLRPASAAEAAMVAEWCERRTIPHVTLHPGEPATGNIQSWARDQRYALLGEWRAANKLDWIFTAHHADDQLETMLMRLNRGAGVNGLAGIRARQGHVLRPLLGARRVQLLAYAEREGLPFVEDPSNSDPRFDRAAIRQRLRGATWLDARAAARSAAALGAVEEALDWAVDALEIRHVRAEGDMWVLDRTDMPRELLRRLLLRLLAQADPGTLPPRGDTVDRAIAAAAQGRQVSIANALLSGGDRWTIRIAPPRR